MRLKTAEVAPIPSASVSTAITVNPGCRSNIRNPKRKSFNIRPSARFRFMWELDAEARGKSLKSFSGSEGAVSSGIIDSEKRKII